MTIVALLSDESSLIYKTVPSSGASHQPPHPQPIATPKYASSLDQAIISTNSLTQRILSFRPGPPRSFVHQRIIRHSKSNAIIPRFVHHPGPRFFLHVVTQNEFSQIRTLPTRCPSQGPAERPDCETDRWWTQSWRSFSPFRPLGRPSVVSVGIPTLPQQPGNQNKYLPPDSVGPPSPSGPALREVIPEWPFDFSVPRSDPAPPEDKSAPLFSRLGTNSENSWVGDGLYRAPAPAPFSFRPWLVGPSGRGCWDNGFIGKFFPRRPLGGKASPPPRPRPQLVSFLSFGLGRGLLD